MKVIIALFLLAGLIACQTKESPNPAIKPTDFVGSYQFSGTITHSDATEGYLQSPQIRSVVKVSGQLQITTFGTGTAIQINETSIDGEVNMRYQASPATKQMVLFMWLIGPYLMLI
ncbi:hypothetical protein WBJ53_26960 [Spirosoma sp. SC4-14]|uniref:hypothetical protein n=1 Tax=Spirosoma sp. SC4-14 TaxID=3128900 RepID=UPI0030CD5D07